MKIIPAFVAFLFAAALGGFASSSNADVIYTWKTLSATPGSVTSNGSISLTDSGFSQGTAQLSSDPIGGTVAYNFNGVESVDFQITPGPHYYISSNDLTNILFNFNVTVDNQYLDFTGGNQAYGGFAVDRGDSDAYYAIGSNDIWTIGYGSDNPSSPCYGGQVPGSGSNRCAVTGVFEDVPEPGTLPILLVGLLVSGLVCGRRRRQDPAMPPG
ncbi:MAG TPA: PEP-CTERM sorting domain-containing protein [Stellaceae bacterium]|nr:PEP-CTERM sorting domain-containing protein [Stellaceae bacterium]